MVRASLCVEVDRLVKSGVALVAAGNSGYGWDCPGKVGVGRPGPHDQRPRQRGARGDGPVDPPRDAARLWRLVLLLEGPTGDGRSKPDLVAPGEKIISCASGWRAEDPSAVDHDEAVAANAVRMTVLKEKLAQWEGPNQGPAAEGGVKPVARYRRTAAPAWRRRTCDRGVPVGAAGVHRAARAREGSVPLHRDRSQARPVFPGQRAGRSDAGDSIGLKEAIMAEVAGFPYFELQFDKQGRVFDPDELQQAVTFLGQSSPTCS